MKRRDFPASDLQFIIAVRQMEERLFPEELDSEDDTRMKSHGRYFWHFRPSHHAQTGLITAGDLELLRQPGRRMLSVGAYPAFLERVLLELGISAENLLVADKDAAIAQCSPLLRTRTFDAHEPWPEMGTFDRILFPESLCISFEDRLQREGQDSDPQRSLAHPTDAREAALLAAVLGQALTRLRPAGIIRANGPMSHPNVVCAMSAALEAQGLHHAVEYQRFFLTVRAKEPCHPSSPSSQEPAENSRHLATEMEEC